MNVYMLHAGQPEAERLIDRLNVRSGRSLPARLSGQETYYVIRWPDDRGRIAESGVQDAPMPPGTRMLQSASAVRRALDKRLRQADWIRNGVNVFHSDSSLTPGIHRRLVVPVFQLEALGVYSIGGAAGPIGRMPFKTAHSTWTPVPSARSVAVRRAEREAIKAVYALGLDYGTVTIVSDRNGVPAVESLDPLPPKEDIFLERFADAIRRFQEEHDKEKRRTDPVMLGMDPEFVLRRPGPDGKIVLASRFLERRGAAGCDSVRIGDRLLYPLAELRPAPAAEPRELFRNLYAAMLLAADKINDDSLEWLAGGMPAQGLALGGHIHVSGAWLHTDLLRVMDNYLALPLVLIEDATTKNRRPRYGALGDFRRQFHGGFEYRTLPSWIVSPVLAMGVLALARIVCDHYRELGQRPLERSDMQEAYYKGNKEKIKPVVAELWNDVERTEGYTRYSRYLNKLKRLLERAEPWNEQLDMRISWKLPPYRD
ncbi:putative amidoligase domain-containing protein [Paenibacillus alkalitolerans]|uniref:putative amidoligase domain-containing protein n=1 Tax=Paenibacillus alkalitolerans TaxID=2799335 RepID=UPI0018F742AE|nr:hypothetical protein [Paenibacillus alkalitolerans]